jgi:hypothetical protein
MALEAFEPNKLCPAHRYVVRQANEIIDEYLEGGFTLTLRQLYYQFVARDLLPENTLNQYKRLGKIIDAARKCGLIDWDAIEDRTRNLRGLNTWRNPQAIIAGAADGYRLDPWIEQKVHVEVWIEKDALIGVVEPVCNRRRVDFFACRGYTSQSEAYGAGKRLASYTDAGYRVVVLHLGDHDPSGVNMTDDNRRRLSLFAGTEIELRRLALNMPQIEQYDPPPNYVKEDDSRTKWYREEFGTESCWELDALDPKVIDALIDEEIAKFVDQEKWDKVIAREEADREILTGIHTNWRRVAEKPWLYRHPSAVRAEAALIVDQASEAIDSDMTEEQVTARLTEIAQEIEAIKLEVE